MRIHQKVNMKSMFFLLFVFIVGTWFGASWRGSFCFIKENMQSKFRHTNENRYVRSMMIPMKPIFDFSTSGNSCLPQRNILFLKTHKTAGSTVQNILLRHAVHYKSFVGLSANLEPRFNYAQGEAFKRTHIRPTNHTINMLCHHMRFNHQEVAAVMPKETVYVTILREPGDVFESYFDYIHYSCPAFARVKQSTSGLKSWLSNPNRYFHGPSDRKLWWFAKNAMFYDLGFDNLSDDTDIIKNAITEMEKTYSLVLISEYLDESLILLRELLCMDLRDIAHLQLNSRSKSNIILDEKMRQQIRVWNKADSMMYDAFNKTFWKKVEEFGKERMNLEVIRLQALSKELQDNCIEGEGVINNLVKDPKNRVYNPRGVEMVGYNLKESSKNNKTCQDVIKPEIQWFRYLLSKQYGPRR